MELRDINPSFKLEKKEKYTAKDVLELFANTLFLGVKDWCSEALESEESAEQALKKFAQKGIDYLPIVQQMNDALNKGNAICFARTSSLRGAGYSVEHYYSHENGYFTRRELNDGKSTD